MIYDEQGNEVAAGSGRAGNICIRNPWPGIMQTVWKDNNRFVSQYYQKYCKDRNSKDWHNWPYFATDKAMLAANGYYLIANSNYLGSADIQPFECQTVAKRSQSPASRHTTQFSTH